MIAKALILFHSVKSIRGEVSEPLSSSRVLKDTPPGYPNCKVDWPDWIGDGSCDGGDYNTEECGWDGGDCIEFNEKYPNCMVDWPSFLENGYCNAGDYSNEGDYNTEECGWDGGDCPSSAAKRLLGIDYLVHIIHLGSFLLCLSYA